MAAPWTMIHGQQHLSGSQFMHDHWLELRWAPFYAYTRVELALEKEVPHPHGRQNAVGMRTAENVCCATID